MRYDSAKSTNVLVGIEKQEDNHHRVVRRPPDQKRRDDDDADTQRLRLRPVHQSSPIQVAASTVHTVPRRLSFELPLTSWKMLDI